MSQDLIVVKVDKARMLLAQASDATDAKRVADIARAAEVYARRQKLSEEAIQYATGVKIDAMTLMGEFLREAPKNEGGRPAKTSSQKEPVYTATLADIGISKKESSDAQALADMKEAEPELHEQVRNGKITLPKARDKKQKNRQTLPPEPPEEPQYPHSERLYRWLQMVDSETSIIDVECGGIRKLLADPVGWNWGDVSAFLLPMIRGLRRTLAKYELEIGARLKKHGKNKARNKRV